jgi:signal transduction histidine kinase
MAHDFQADIVIRQTTGMRFAAIARVTEGRWVACSVLDQIDFGLEPGGELTVETTIRHEIRQGREGVVIDHVAEDEIYRGNPTPARPVRVNGSTGEGAFKLSIVNSGEPMPPASMPQLFHPFTRGLDHSRREGLGLGLFIASEITHAHEGMLTAASSGEETWLTFRMPLR